MKREPKRFLERVVLVPRAHDDSFCVGSIGFAILENIGVVEYVVDAFAVRPPRHDVRKARSNEFSRKCEYRLIRSFARIPREKEHEMLAGKLSWRNNLNQIVGRSRMN